MYVIGANRFIIFCENYHYLEFMSHMACITLT